MKIQKKHPEVFRGDAVVCTWTSLSVEALSQARTVANAEDVSGQHKYAGRRTVPNGWSQNMPSIGARFV